MSSSPRPDLGRRAARRKTLCVLRPTRYTRLRARGLRLPSSATWDAAEQAREIRDRIETYEEWYARQERIKRGERPDEDVFDSNHISD